MYQFSLSGITGKILLDADEVARLIEVADEQRGCRMLAHLTKDFYPQFVGHERDLLSLIVATQECSQ